MNVVVFIMHNVLTVSTTLAFTLALKMDDRLWEKKYGEC